MNLRSFSLFRRALLSLVLPVLCVAPALAVPITGVVTNRTTNKPAAGDDVVLIRLAQGMQESTRSKTDARGHFSLDVPDEGNIHLVRVTHDKANYFKPVQPGTNAVDIDVFNAAEKVEGVVGEAEVMRLQTDESGKNLRVIENFFVKNDSDPPKTQFGDRAFEFHLPDGAVIEGSAALAPGGMPVQSAPVPLGDPGHFAFAFPIRPGETRFQITYHVPYSGSLRIQPRPSLQTDTVAIMMPKSMGFKAGPASAFSPVTEETTAQTYVARGISPSQPLDFTVSGAGQLPRETPQSAAGGGQDAQGGAANAPEASGAAGAQPDQTKFGGGLGKPLDPEGNNDPWAKYKWWIIGGLGLVLAAGAGLFLRTGGAAPAAVTANTVAHTAPAGGRGDLLAAIKEELFQLETDRLQGRVTEGEYTEAKAALEVVLRRALRRVESLAGSVQ